jgi:signal transduction histidine kinase
MPSEVVARPTKNQVFTHEFVNSLTSVRSLAELLVENPGLDAGDRSQFITIIRDETERLVRLMNHVNLETESVASL